MLLVDDILTAPVRGILWIFREIHNAAEQELANEEDTITEQLRMLYMELETGRITEQQFDAGEKVLLDRLDAIQSDHEDMEEEEAEAMGVHVGR